MKKILLSLLLLASIAVNAQEFTTLSKSTYSIKYPSTWVADENADAKGFTIKSPTEGQEDVFVENLNLAIEKLTSFGYTAQDYAAFSKGYLPQKIKNFTVITNKKGTLGKDSWFMEFKGLQNNKKLQWKQYYIVVNSKVHILTFTAEPDKYKNYLPVANAMMASYKAK
jgi:hypothetical protein